MSFFFGLYGSLTAIGVAFLEIWLRRLHPALSVALSSGEAWRSLALIWAVLVALAAIISVFKRPILAAGLFALTIGLEYFGSHVFWIFPLAFWIIGAGLAIGSYLWSRSKMGTGEEPNLDTHLGDVG